MRLVSDASIHWGRFSLLEVPETEWDNPCVHSQRETFLRARWLPSSARTISGQRQTSNFPLTCQGSLLWSLLVTPDGLTLAGPSPHLSRPPDTLLFIWPCGGHYGASESWLGRVTQIIGSLSGKSDKIMTNHILGADGAKSLNLYVCSNVAIAPSMIWDNVSQFN